MLMVTVDDNMAIIVTVIIISTSVKPPFFFFDFIDSISLPPQNILPPRRRFVNKKLEKIRFFFALISDFMTDYSARDHRYKPGKSRYRSKPRLRFAFFLVLFKAGVVFDFSLPLVPEMKIIMQTGSREKRSYRSKRKKQSPRQKKAVKQIRKVVRFGAETPKNERRRKRDGQRNKKRQKVFSHFLFRR
jgi:hypothetical protein